MMSARRGVVAVLLEHQRAGAVVRVKERAADARRVAKIERRWPDAAHETLRSIVKDRAARVAGLALRRGVLRGTDRR